MGRSRSVKPEICTSETMARVSAEVERTFVRMWTHCDDEGRCKDNPRLIKAGCFPLHDDVTPDVISDHLDVMEKEGMIVRYEVEGVATLSIPSWSKHQHPQRRTKSTLAPPPPSPPAETTPSASPPRDIRDTYSPVVVVGEGDVEVVVEVEVAAEAVEVERQLSPREIKNLWTEWYAIYPRHESPAAGLKAYTKVIKVERISPVVLLEAARRYRDLPGREPRYTKMPATWLNQGCWDDELVPRTEGTVTDRNRAAMVDHLNGPRETLRDRIAAARALPSQPPPQELGDPA